MLLNAAADSRYGGKSAKNPFCRKRPVRAFSDRLAAMAVNSRYDGLDLSK